MVLVQGDLWREVGQADLLLVTTNATLKANGALVMGRGAALEARERYPGLDLVLGRALRARAWDRPLTERPMYGILTTAIFDRGTELGAFQVKIHFREKADSLLISYATGMLHGWILRQEAALERPYRVAMNFPGIGFGGLSRTQVLPLIQSLPDSVTVYERPAP